MSALLFSLNNNPASVLSRFHSQAFITLYHPDTLSNSAGLQVSEDLLSDFDLSTIGLISKVQALLEFGATAGFGTILGPLSMNPLPATSLVAPQLAEPVAVESMASRLGELRESATEASRPSVAAASGSA